MIVSSLYSIDTLCKHPCSECYSSTMTLHYYYLPCDKLFQVTCYWPHSSSTQRMRYMKEIRFSLIFVGLGFICSSPPCQKRYITFPYHFFIIITIIFFVFALYRRLVYACAICKELFQFIFFSHCQWNVLTLRFMFTFCSLFRALKSENVLSIIQSFDSFLFPSYPWHQFDK